MTTILHKAASVLLMGAVITAGAFVALPQLTGTASAEEAYGQSYASVTELNDSSQNGQVDEIYVSSSGEVQWRNMPEGAETVNVKLAVENEDGEYETFAERDYSVDGNQSGVYNWGTSDDNTVEGEIIENTSYEADDFSADDDGETRKENLDIRVTVTVIGPDGTECAFVETHKLKTEVTNLHNPSAGGSSNIDGEIDMDRSDDDCVECVPYTEEDTDEHTETETEHKHTETETESDDTPTDEQDTKHHGEYNGHSHPGGADHDHTDSERYHYDHEHDGDNDGDGEYSEGPNEDLHDEPQHGHGPDDH